MVGWHPQLSGHEFEQTLRYSEGQGSLACYSPWCHKEQLNNNPKNGSIKGSKVMVIKIFTNIGRRMDEHSENFHIRKYQTEVKTGLKNTLAEKYSRIDERENESVSWKKKQWNSSTQSSKIKLKKFF